MNEERNTNINNDTGNNSDQTLPELNAGHKNTFMAVLSYFSILVLIPLIVAKENSFVKFHAKQGLVLLIASVVIWILKMMSLENGIITILNIFILILIVIGVVNVIQGKEKNLPLIGQFSKYFSF